MKHESEKGDTKIRWINGYTDEVISPVTSLDETVIIYGLEMIVKTFLDEENSRQSFGKWLDMWLDCENGNQSLSLIFIGTEIGKGIVPMNKQDRLFRDMVGWCFQDVAMRADRVDMIWYGLSQRLK